MSLTTQVASQVDSDIRTRGRQYFLDGSVRILEGTQRHLEAEVRGTKAYHVSMKLARKNLRVGCTCPYFLDNLLTCKHIWATLLAADAQDLLREAERTRALQLVEDDELAFDEDWDEEPAEWEEEGWPSFPRPMRTPAPRPKSTKPKKPRPPSWQQQLSSLRDDKTAPLQPRIEPWPAGREILYIVDVPSTMTSVGLSLEVVYRERKRDGEWSKPKAQRIPLSQVPALPDPADRQVMAFLVGAREQSPYYAGYNYNYYSYESAPCRYVLPDAMQEALVPSVCRTGRCRLRLTPDPQELQPISWDEGGPYEFHLEIAPQEGSKNYAVAGVLCRGEERLPLTAPVLLLASGLVFFQDRAARLEHFGAFRWIAQLRSRGSFTVPADQRDELLKEMLQLPQLPRLDLPEEMRFEEQPVTPRPRLKVRPAQQRMYSSYARLHGELSFDYEGEVVPAEQQGRGVYQADRRRFVLRDPAAERDAAEKLRQLGFKPQHSYGQQPTLELAPRNLPRAVRTLLEAGWHVEAEGKLYRQPGEFRIEVTSGIDWFELHGSVKFGDTEAKLPDLLAALKRGDNSVRLGDGTYGVLPEEWLKKYGLLAGLGTPEDGHLRFTRSQVGLLDALLAAQPEATWDEAFTKARDELRNFEGIQPLDPPAGFVGTLRDYQRDGLGWLHFLQRFGFGGCLADDMGLGKTIQVLALLEARRELRARSAEGNGTPPKRPAPSLVVVPRSLVFNWQQEAARFTPQLKVLDHTGIDRVPPGAHFNDYDAIVTTYGTLRRDILQLKDVPFDYCILDEGQAVKNAHTESAKAVRLLRADHRLALSGTPVENHLGELWSLFEFLNPGMLGSASVFRLGGAGARNPDEDTRVLLAKALRPFILRRTKNQVAKDLPQKTEQTLYCEMEPVQRKLYDELREHYRETLLKRVASEGINKNKIQVLEALLRLRQAACHPGLIDKARSGEAAAKLDMLLPQLGEVTEEGHKVLVFSQFTSLLAIVRQRLDAEGITYEYLDGRTRNRQEKVERFQNDPECKLFLISLKAGGLGLNLTAAEYVFLLDPWWNPAVEAQAIDRTHRIGQTRPVFAYRLIAKNTVEEKVLELQKTKRDLADAIINADNSLIRDLSQEDLQLLLS